MYYLGCATGEFNIRLFSYNFVLSHSVLLYTWVKACGSVCCIALKKIMQDLFFVFALICINIPFSMNGCLAEWYFYSICAYHNANDDNNTCISNVVFYWYAVVYGRVIEVVLGCLLWRYCRHACPLHHRIMHACVSRIKTDFKPSFTHAFLDQCTFPTPQSNRTALVIPCWCQYKVNNTPNARKKCLNHF